MAKLILPESVYEGIEGVSISFHMQKLRTMLRSIFVNRMFKNVKDGYDSMHSEDDMSL